MSAYQPPPPGPGAPISPAVLVIAAFALLGVIFATIWDGGGAPELSTPTAPVPAGSNGSAGSGGQPSQAPPFTEALLGNGGVPVQPPSNEYGATLAWSFYGEWRDIEARYRAAFPVPGWGLSTEVRTGTRSGRRVVGQGYDVIPAGATDSLTTKGVLAFREDPQDRSKTVVTYTP